MITKQRGTLARLLKPRSDAAAEAPALLAPGRPPISYGALRENCARLKGMLRKRGITQADRVALALENGADLAIALLGISTCSVCTPLDVGGSREELTETLKRIRPSLLVSDGSANQALDAAQTCGVQAVSYSDVLDAPANNGDEGQVDEPSPEDIALILQTSATTSLPKLVPLTHANLLSSAEAVARSVRLTPQDRCLTFLPLHHAQGILSGLLSTLVSNGTVAVLPGLRLPDFFRWLEQYRPTWFTAVPAMLQAIAVEADRHRDTIDRLSLRCIRSGAASLSPDLIRRLEETFKTPVIEAYGMTEAGTPITTNPFPPGARKPGTVGPAFGAEVGILASDHRFLRAGEEGEIVLRGPSIMKGYLEDPAANSEAFHEGWFRTGDVGKLDEDGYLTITGRLKDLINRGGEKISPGQVEKVLLSHRSVKEAAAFPVPHSTLGEDVAAAVVLKEGTRASPHELRNHCLLRLPSAAVPRKVLVLPALPRTARGKIARASLADSLNLDQGDSLERKTEERISADEVEEELVQLWRSVLGRKRIGLDDDFSSLGGNSLSAIQLIDRVGRRFGIALPTTVVIESPTIRGLAGVIRRRRKLRSSVVRLSRGSGSPFFCIHGADGTAWTFHGLARHIRPRIPFYGIEALSLTETDSARDLGEFADRYVGNIREIQPRGPYRVGGYCSGGFLAVEVARRLRAAGEQVPVLALFDPPIPTPHRSKKNSRFLVDHLRRSVRGLLADPVATTTFTLQSIALALQGASLWIHSGESEQKRRMLATLKAQHTALWKHRLLPYDGPLTVFLNRTTPRFQKHLRDSWNRVGSHRVEFVPVQGGHFGLFRGMNAVRIARALGPLLADSEFAHRTSGAPQATR